MQAPRHDARACHQDPGGHHSVCVILEVMYWQRAVLDTYHNDDGGRHQQPRG